ncbi:endo-1,4-beta-xylanase [Psychrosphaera algicola]|uniref:Endo-1,4-beta-xylanase n=1 Tax=Psychrosphaera algicola TaxID=3023714 RepID=A0ABT5FI03_9GAMM|nr:endo-1,4-beta-xylanase [Psychrosphaera sp. G1-22]MDC2890827.1 endo-1,4-beta-xylanase [Psychrosphaera sp. G1-22]
MLQKEGIRIDGVGIQAHWGLNFPRMEYIEDAIDAYSALGIKVMITELDIDVLPLTKEGQIIGVDMMKPQFQLEEFEAFWTHTKRGYLRISKRNLPPVIKHCLSCSIKNVTR